MTVVKEQSVNLTRTPETVQWPEMHYVFLEKIGPFPVNAPLAWNELHKLLPAIEQQNTIVKYFSLYKVAPQIYRAGVALAAKPSSLPEALAYEKFHGGKYAKFTLTGAYSQLPKASALAFQIVSDSKLPLRDDYNIENYVTDPRGTPEDKLITEIMFPTI